MNKAAQVLEEQFSIDHINMVNECTITLKNHPEMRLRFWKMDRKSLHLRVYTDAAFGTNEDRTSQIGYLILLCDGKDNAEVLDFSSKKSGRVVRSIMGGEFIAFVDGFDQGWMLRYDPDRIYHQDVPTTMLTDSK